MSGPIRGGGSNAGQTASVAVFFRARISATVLANELQGLHAAMRLFCWNINALVRRHLLEHRACALPEPVTLLHLFHSASMQVPTIPNFRLTHGSVRGFFDSQKADVVCFQARPGFLHLFYTGLQYVM